MVGTARPTVLPEHKTDDDPQKHHRHSTRLKGYDYALPGAYFVTVCTYQREYLLGRIESGRIVLSDAGEMVQRCWENTAHHFPFVELDAFVIMPNHVHGVIAITEFRRGEASALQIRAFNPPSESDASPLHQRPNGTQPGSLSAILQNLKSVSTRKTNAARGTPGAPVWQRGFYERVVRDEAELAAIREYILANPARCDEDENNPAIANR